MTRKSKMHMSFLRAAYLNGYPLAIFEALNIVMDYLPYEIDSPSGQSVNEVPVWILQALRESVVFHIENEKRTKVGAKPQDNMKLLASLSKGYAQAEKTKTKNELPLYDLAQQLLIEKFGEGLQPESIKKYAAEFDREDRNFENIGKYLSLFDEDAKIYQAVKEGIF